MKKPWCLLWWGAGPFLLGAILIPFICASDDTPVVTDASGEVIAISKVYDDGTMDIMLTTEGDPNDPNRISFATIEFPKPTHICPVHGELGGDWTTDVMSIELYLNGEKDGHYDFCGKCAYGYLVEVLKANIPQLTEITNE